jgi:hypothetical protein
MAITMQTVFVTSMAGNEKYTLSRGQHPKSVTNAKKEGCLEKQPVSNY